MSEMDSALSGSLWSKVTMFQLESSLCHLSVTERRCGFDTAADTEADVGWRAAVSPRTTATVTSSSNAVQHRESEECRAEDCG